MNKLREVTVLVDLTFCECNRDFFWNLSTIKGEVMSLS